MTPKIYSNQIVKSLSVNLTFLIVLCLSSCNTLFTEYDINTPLQPDLKLFNHSNHVTQQELEYFLSLTKVDTKSADDVLAIEPYLVDSDTVMFIVNHSSGWEVISADKRTPLLLAMSDTGQISTDISTPQGQWLLSMGNDMHEVFLSRDDELTFTQEEIDANMGKWPSTLTSINPNWPDPQPFDSLEIFGHWELYSEGYETETVSYVNHLTETQWDQDWPYNIYCPDDTPAGCAAVAAGQMIRFLHDKFGMPSHSIDGINLDALSTTYSQYLTSSVDSTARFLSEVGDDLNMHYNNNGSWALPSKIVDLFESYGYSCEYDSFDDGIVESSLFQNMPVIVLAMDQLWETGIPDLSYSHYFLIDGYRKMRERYVKRYIFVCDNTDPQPSQTELFKTEVVAQYAPYISYVKMNWGWWSQWQTGYQLNDGWYALTGSWTTHNSSGDDTQYDYARHMFYDFEQD